jgi:HTH-type transcriptional repressor of NAD biosynthesis genes
MKTPRRGMVLGKFMPPHLGHVYLCEFAAQWVDELYIVVGTLAAEPISGKLRYDWMRELFPNAIVLHLQDENPQAPEEHPEFWTIWKQSLERILPHPIDLVFASESYGAPLAEILGAAWIPVDLARGAVPISGTAIRSMPLQYWKYLPRSVRPYFMKKVCVVGPESTGKSTLVKLLAEKYHTVFVPEYARGYLEALQRDPTQDEMLTIARGQHASEAALARNAERLLFCDTDALTTCLWSQWLFGACEQALWQEAAKGSYELSLLLDVDVPWVGDSVRYFPEKRQQCWQECLDLQRAHHRRIVLISGSWEERMEKACAAVDTLLAESGG